MFVLLLLKTKFSAHASKATESVLVNFEGVYKQAQQVKDSNAKENKKLKQVWQKIQNVSTVCDLAFITDFIKCILNPISLYFQETSHLPWHEITLYKQMINKMQNIKNKLCDNMLDMSEMYSSLPLTKDIATQFYGKSQLVYKNCILTKSFRENENPQNPLFVHHSKWISFIDRWIAEIKNDIPNRPVEHTMISQSICPYYILQLANDCINNKIPLETYVSDGNSQILQLCIMVDRNDMQFNQIWPQFKIFKMRVLDIVKNGTLDINFAKSQKELKRHWRKEYELIRLFDTNETLCNDINLYWNFFCFFYSKSQSETHCESAFSKTKYSAAHRPNLDCKRLANISKIQTNGPKFKDEDIFLQKVSKKCAKKFNPPLATGSKFIVSRCLDGRLNKVSGLDFSN